MALRPKKRAEGKRSGRKARRLSGPAPDRASDGDQLPRLPSNCFRTGREHTLNLMGWSAASPPRSVRSEQRRHPMEIHTVGIDLGKTVFHLVGLNIGGEVVVRKKYSRK